MMNPDSVLFHIPHASIRIPEEFRGDFAEGVLPDNPRFMTDRYTDELFDCGFGARVVFPVSRLLCDPERFREDEREEMAKIGMGAVCTRGYDLRSIRALSPGRREGILRRFYDPHHKRLEEAAARAMEETGRCLLFDCHSFSAVPLPYETDAARPDFCVGTDPFHTPDALRDMLIRPLRDRGFGVEVNRPFPGALIPLRYFGRERRVWSVMIEVNRGLYMENGERSERFEEIRAAIREAVSACLRL